MSVLEYLEFECAHVALDLECLMHQKLIWCDYGAGHTVILITVPFIHPGWYRPTPVAHGLMQINIKHKWKPLKMILIHVCIFGYWENLDFTAWTFNFQVSISQTLNILKLSYGLLNFQVIESHLYMYVPYYGEYKTQWCNIRSPLFGLKINEKKTLLVYYAH
jgi:hypothetical protein